MNQFDNTQGTRSDLGMSNASSIGLPGMGTLRQGINIPGQGGPTPAQLRELSLREETAKQMSSG